MSKDPKRLVSIVTPCFNEELNVEAHFERVSAAIAPFRDRYVFEHIYTDNCSFDATFEVLTRLSSRHSNVRVMRFSRNVGAIRAMVMGLERAKGEAAILIQADLQDPPELLPRFIEGWESGHDVVYGVITNRVKESPILQMLRRWYYVIIDRLSEVRTPRNAGDFRLLSRKALNALKMYREYDIYLRGVVAHIGFKQKSISYERQPRAKGESQAPFFYLIAFALNGLVSTSVAPLRAITAVGIVSAIIGFILGLYFTIFRIVFPEMVPAGITIITVLVTFFGGVQLLALGIIGEYIRKIYLEALERPRGFVQDEINFESGLE